MIRLVLKAARGESFGFAFVPLASHVLRAECRPFGALQGRVNFPDGEAALLARLFTFRGDDLGVGGDEFDPGAIHHEEAQGEADLRRGQAHSFRRVHRLEHVLAQPRQFFVKNFYGVAHLVQHLRRVLGYLPQRHLFYFVPPAL